MFSREPKRSNNQTFPRYSKLALTGEHASQSTASRTSCRQHKHATSRTIPQHWATITPVGQLYKPTTTSTSSAGRPPKPKTSNKHIFQDILKLALTREHARPGLALTTSYRQHKHATSKSITQHRNAIIPPQRLGKPPEQRTRRNPCTIGFVLQQSKLSRKNSKPRPHQKVCTLRSSIKNVLSPALARYEQNHHASFERDHTAPTAWQTHNSEHAEISSQSAFVLTRTQRFHKSTLIPKISKLALTRKHALQSTASRISPRQHKHAKGGSITQH